MFSLTRPLSLVALSLLLACSDAKPDADSAQPSEDSPSEETGELGSLWYPDEDQDGYGDADAEGVRSESPPDGSVASNDDCDDTRTNVNPGAQELCNGRDDDCDGLTDGADALDAERWYADRDGDGYGDPDNSVFDCEQGEGYTEDFTDCDDTDAEVYPNHEETCNGVDDDCDGDVDNDPDERWGAYADADGDGYGDEDTLIEGVGCGDAIPEGYVTNYLDCDDSLAWISPDGTEVCGNEIDENCDQTPSDCAFWGRHGLHEADGKVFEDLPEGGGFAAFGLEAQDSDGDGLTDLWVGANETWIDGVQSGHVLLARAPIAGSLDLATDSAAEVHGADDKAWMGCSVQDAGDVDGDGYPELWIGACYDGGEGADAGSATLMFGPFAGSMDVADAERRWFGTEPGQRVGYKIGGGADIDGDGAPDAVIGAPWSTGSGGFTGAVFLVYEDGSTGTLSLEDASAAIYGDTPDDTLGNAAAVVGDTNGDGLADVALGAYSGSYGGLDSGAAYILDDLPSGGVFVASEVGQFLAGEDTQDFAGFEAAGLGDLNGDGFDDVGIGADLEGENHAGAVYVLYGPVGDRDDLAEADAKLQGVDDYEYTATVAGGQDMDGDGSGDLVIGAYYRGLGGYLGGKVYLVRGPLEEGTSSLSEADAVFYGEDRGDSAGQRVRMAPDINGDGYADAVVASRGADISESVYGAVYLMFGQPE